MRLIVELNGPEADVNQALEELISNVEYDNLDVRVIVFAEDRISAPKGQEHD